MGIRIHKPTTNGRRRSSVLTFEELTAYKPHKPLLVSIGSKAGRNAQGKITVRHQGGGVKRFYRVIDFRQNKYNISATVSTIEYDPYRSAFIALLNYRDGEKRYMLAPEGLKAGDTVMSSKNKIEAKVGNRMPLDMMPLGTVGYNIELTPAKGGEIVRSAVDPATLMAGAGDSAVLQLPSGEVGQVAEGGFATAGQGAN